MLVFIANSANAERWLSCAMVDMVQKRVVDHQEAKLNDQALLWLFGYGPISGMVKDEPTAEAGKRDLHVQLYHRTGNEESNGQSFVTYYVQQEINEWPLTRLIVEEPLFRKPISLSCYLVERPEKPVGVLARTGFESGRGSEGGFCDYNSSWFCVDRIKQRAQDQAVNDASLTCHIKGGKPDGFFPSCTDFCTPLTIPDDGQHHFVNCSSNCSIRCDYP